MWRLQLLMDPDQGQTCWR